MINPRLLHVADLVNWHGSHVTVRITEKERRYIEALSPKKKSDVKLGRRYTNGKLPCLLNILQDVNQLNRKFQG